MSRTALVRTELGLAARTGVAREHWVDRELHEPVTEGVTFSVREGARGGKGIKSFVLARRLGVHPRTIRRAINEGILRAVQHGPRLALVPAEEVRLVQIYGLQGLARMRVEERL